MADGFHDATNVLQLVLPDFQRFGVMIVLTIYRIPK